MISSILNFFKTTWYSFMNFFGIGLNKSIQASNSIYVYIRTNVGEQVCVALQPSSTVQMVKCNLANKLQTSEEQLRIIFAGKELPDELTIGECDLGNRSILHAVRVETGSTQRKKPCEVKVPDSLPESSEPKETLIDADSTQKSSKGFKSENEVGHTSTVDPAPSKEPKQRVKPSRNTKLLCDASTVMTIQLSEEELKELNKLKAADGEKEKPHFYVYCIKPCASVCVGKLRVRCFKCKGGALTVHTDPQSWLDVLQTKRISATCENPVCDGGFAEFFFKCGEHETLGEDDTAVVLYLLRTNLPGVACLACTDVSSPIVVFECQNAHVMCLDCFVTYCVSRLNERQFVCDDTFGYTLPCPIGCRDSLVKEIHHFKLMGEQHYERYQRFGTEEALLAGGGVLCPYPGCGQGIFPDPECRRVKCVGGCEFVFCRECLQGYHIGECSTDWTLKGEMPDSSDVAFAIDHGRAVFSSWDEASSVTIRVISKPCPKCRTPTERSGGCMHMVCTRVSCQFHWCWVCQTEWTRECMAAHWFG